MNSPTSLSLPHSHFIYNFRVVNSPGISLASLTWESVERNLSEESEKEKRTNDLNEGRETHARTNLYKMLLLIPEIPGFPKIIENKPTLKMIREFGFISFILSLSFSSSLNKPRIRSYNL